MNNCDILLVGATGEYGKLIANHLVASARAHHTGRTLRDLRVGLCGDDGKELTNMRDEIGTENWRVFESGCDTQEEVDELVRKAKVVCNTLANTDVSSRFVRACIQLEVDYCDISFEPLWLRTLIEKYHETSKSNGVFIIPACGFLSTVSDLSVMLAEQALREQIGRVPSEIQMLNTHIPYLLPTQTTRDVYKRIFEGRQLITLMRDAFYLNPVQERPLATQATFAELDQLGIGYSRLLRMWTYPSGVRGFVNTRVVRRSIALRGHHYVYNEADGSSSFINTIFGFALQVVFFILALFHFARDMCFQLTPISRPSFFDAFDRSSPLDASSSPHKFQAKLVATSRSMDHDPSHAFVNVWSNQELPQIIASCAAETAICLAREKDNALLTKTSVSAGIATPSTAFGMVLVERLKRSNVLHFSVKVEGSKD